MSEFFQVFFEEAAELLEEMETLLIDLDLDNPNLEDLNAIFRVAHSIKGGAATFGFTDMAEVTHVLENLLDRLRKQELALRAEMIDAFLMARDVVRAQLAGHRGDGQADPADAVVIREILSRLASGEDAKPDTKAASANTTASAASVQDGKKYRVEFHFSSARASFDHLLNSLRQTGTVHLITDIGAGESGAKVTFDPCVLELTTTAAEEDIWEALAFIVDPARIKIESADAETTATAASAAAPAVEEDDGFGFFEPLYNAVTADPATADSAAATTLEPQPAPVAVAAVPVPEVPHRRATDDPELAATPRGRRESDKTAPAASADSTSIRVNIEKVDQLINLVGELVITQAMLTQAVSNIDPVLHESLLHGIDQLERNTRDLQESVMSIRMMPIGFVFSRFPRLVRDLAGKLDKQVELKTIGEATELDKGLIEKLSDPLTHLVRNSLDHGVETPEKRIAAGKPAKGTVTLRAFHQGGNVIIEISDDGAGLNRERILAKARERGFPVNDNMSDQDVWQLIFEAGFSTAETVTDVSGRGVGMDVVKRNIKALGGSIELQSTLGVGTRTIIRLPLTLAILDGMSVAVGDEVFIIPLTAIVESLQPGANDIKTVGGDGRLVNVRGEYLPVVALHELFNIRPRTRGAGAGDAGIMVILESEGIKKAVMVDDLLGQHQVVIKSLETNFRRVVGISGATIMGDGRVALILDIAGIVRMETPAMLQAA